LVPTEKTGYFYEWGAARTESKPWGWRAPNDAGLVTRLRGSTADIAAFREQNHRASHRRQVGKRLPQTERGTGRFGTASGDID
jgi:hypothetical protein